MKKIFQDCHKILLFLFSNFRNGSIFLADRIRIINLSGIFGKINRSRLANFLTSISIIIAAMFYIAGNYCSILVNYCEENNIEKLGIGMPISTVDKLLGQPHFSYSINLSDDVYRSNTLTGNMFSGTISAYLLHNYVVTVVNYENNINCFYIYGFSKRKNDQLPYYGFSHHVILNKTSISEFDGTPYYINSSNRRSARLEHMYGGGEMGYDYNIAGILGEDSEGERNEIGEYITGNLSNLSLNDDGNRKVKSLSMYLKYQDFKINVYGVSDEICIENKIEPFGENQFYLSDEKIRSNYY